MVPSVIGTPVASPDPAPNPDPAPAPAPLPNPNPIITENLTGNNGYTGAGGNAVGGSVTESTKSRAGLLDAITGGKSLLSAFSENAGGGGDASSGPAIVHGILGGSGLGKGSLGKVLAPGGRPGAIPLTGINVDQLTSNANVGNAYSGSGGNAAGGSVNSPGSLIDLWSHNAGGGGKASSGISRVVRRKDLNKNWIEKHAGEEADDYDLNTLSPPPTIEPRRLVRTSRPAY
ncbi:hypothetical protein FA13DRAFT_1785571 [Coprinellus micaceus]|uniref:Uncharacterized protein n=1 Tax=Coprinellus micaceus TaxID=71717 RepID=A0A4Y7TYR1_COPMI|nr:hypothetical protein FA13DRAFT_1785571 [Coprinellus micaceus]